jgi:hypothetical protein|tara:strand:+ start:1093 stop:1221 length:129 start_codon:yes stop_codon:yes gene_type:complete
MYGNILLIKKRNEKEYIVKINKVQTRTQRIIIKDIEGKVDEI